MNSWIRKKTGITKAGCRNKLEEDLERHLKAKGITGVYEIGRLAYTKGTAHYTPDFILPNGIIIEAKGLFLPADRTKHLLLKEQYPDLEVRFVFNNPKARYPKTVKTTYGKWCDNHGFKYAAKTIPDCWLSEEPIIASIAVIETYLIRKKFDAKN